jgi:hypothetical protein
MKVSRGGHSDADRGASPQGREASMTGAAGAAPHVWTTWVFSPAHPDSARPTM